MLHIDSPLVIGVSTGSLFVASAVAQIALGLRAITGATPSGFAVVMAVLALVSLVSRRRFDVPGD